ncbi:MAG TPA: methylmalonyl Co-A mutase-associated GTPase MeaB [Smithellaceae bacterium]|nr:methylmalonyl Co-A mutase-associated GTPase MeaB [Smithellaceae bacterium]
MERVKKVCRGDIRAASRLIRDIEDKMPSVRIEIKNLFAHTGKSHIIGITGAPGVGKSTLTDALIAALRKKNKTIGVLAVDPTSPFSGGAILGDRIRMQRHAEDEGVFIRSLATRGTLGGLSQAVGMAIHVLEAMGKDIILVETVGIGQQEIDIINHAHSVIVVLVPGMGDEVQAMKAGLMEIADIFVINKADRSGARQLLTELQAMLGNTQPPSTGWRPPVIMSGNAYEPLTFAESTAALGKKIEEHYIYLQNSGALTERLNRRALAEINDALKAVILEPFIHNLEKNGELQKAVEKVKNRENDPHSIAEELAQSFLK